MSEQIVTILKEGRSDSYGRPLHVGQNVSLDEHYADSLVSSGFGRRVVTAAVAASASRCFSEQFANGTSGYNSSGDATIFSVADGVLSIASQNAGPLAIASKIIPLIAVDNFKFKVKLGAMAADDAAFLWLYDNFRNQALVGLAAARETGFDALRRPQLWWSNNPAESRVTTFVWPAALTEGKWYQFTIYNNLVNVFCDVTDIATSVKVTTNCGTFVAPGPSIDRLQFASDGSNVTTTAVAFSDIKICPAGETA